MDSFLNRYYCNQALVFFNAESCMHNELRLVYEFTRTKILSCWRILISNLFFFLKILPGVLTWIQNWIFLSISVIIAYYSIGEQCPESEDVYSEVTKIDHSLIWLQD